MIFIKTEDNCSIIPFRICIDFLKNLPENYEIDKRYDLQDGIYCSIASYETDNSGIIEAHKKYVDLHCVLSGAEYMCVGFVDESEAGEYVEERDFLPIHMVPQSKVLLTPGTVLGIFPNDAHMAKVPQEQGKSVSLVKAIFKIPIELFC